MPDIKITSPEEYEWITVVKDKKPNETWRQYAERAAAHWGLSAEVVEQYDAGISLGRKPRVSALEALETFDCSDDENRENIKVYRSKGKWVERPRLLKVPNDLLEFMEGTFTFTPYKMAGKNHTEIVIDDSEVLAFLLVCAVIADGKIPTKVKRVAREGHLAALSVNRRRNRE